MSTVLVSVSGPDRAGVTPALLRCLAKTATKLLDVGQSVTHGHVTLNLLLSDAHALEALTAEAKKLGLTVTTESEQRLTRVREKYVLSCIAEKTLTPDFLAEVTELLTGLGLTIHRIDNLSLKGLKALDVEATASASPDLTAMKTKLLSITSKHGIDAAFLKDDLFRYNKRLIVFDMDSTLIQAEVIDEMAESMGVGDKVKGITERAMNGELDFDEALKERVALLKGMPRKNLEEIMGRLPLTDGALALIQTVKKLGYKTAIVSGGFSYFVETLRERLGMDYAFANELEWNGDVLAGTVRGTVINAQKKAELLDVLAKKERIHLEQVVAVGDGANDLPMLAKAGLGIAFHAKEKVKKEARHQLSHNSMTSILYLLGIPGKHFDETL